MKMVERCNLVGGECGERKAKKDSNAGEGVSCTPPQLPFWLYIEQIDCGI